MSERLAQLEQFVMEQNSTIASLTAQLAAAKEERDSVYALGPHPVEQCQNISLRDFVSTRFVQVWEFNEKCDQLAEANAEIGRLRNIEAALPKTADGVAVVPGSVVYYRYGSIVQQYTLRGFTADGTVYFDPSGFSALWDWKKCFSCESLAGDGGGK